MNALLNALERRSLVSKLMLAFSTLLLLLLLLGILSIRAQQSLTAQMQQTFDADLLGVSNAKDIQIDYTIIGRLLRQAAIVPAGPRREQALKQLADNDLEIRREVGELRPRIFREDAKRALVRFEEVYAAHKNNVDRAVALLNEGKESESATFSASDEFARAGVAVSEAISVIVRIKEEGAREATLANQKLAAENIRLFYILLGAGVGFGLLLAWLIVLSIRRPAERVRVAVEQLAQGQLEVDIPHRDFGNEIGGLARAVQVLQTGAHQMEAQSWTKSSLASISNALQTANNFSELCQTLFAHLAPLIKIGHGVLYIFDEDSNRLRLLGGYAYRERKSLDQYFALGQGLVGQCALERMPIILSQAPKDYVRIGSSLGEATPNAIAVLPILRNERLLGVIELATFVDFGDKEQALLDGMVPILAMNLEILERNIKTGKLLEETQRQAEAMRVQAMELEAQKDLLLAQHEKLEASQTVLAESRARLQQILDTSPVSVAFSTKGQIHFANPMFVQTFGAKAGDNSPQLYVNSAERDLLIQKLKSEGVVGNYEVQMFDQRHRVRDMLITYLPLNYDGEDGILGWLMDITERKRAEKKIIFNRYVVENSGPMFWIDPVNATVVYANKASCDHLGYTVGPAKFIFQ